MKRIDCHAVETADFSKFSDTEDRIMQYACLLPECGLDETLFSETVSHDERIAIENLKKSARLLSRRGGICLDPAIRETLGPPSIETCTPFLNMLWDAYDPHNMRKHSLYRQMIPIYLSAFSMSAEEDTAADNAMRAARIMRTCYVRLHEAQALAEFAAETREAREDFAGAAAAFRLSSALLSDLNRPEEAIESALRAYEIDCFRRGDVDPAGLAEDYYRMGAATASAGFNEASQAALFISSALLYRKVPGLERCLRENDLLDPIYVDPNDDDVVFPLLLNRKILRNDNDAEDAELIIKKLEAMSESAETRMTFSDRCLDAYLRIMKYLSLHANAQTEASVLKIIDIFLNSFHNSVCLMIEERLLDWLNDIVEIRRMVFPNDSCVIELVNCAIEMSAGVSHADSEQSRREALENCLAAALESLKEAEEKACHETVYPLTELADVSMDFAELETDPEKAELRRTKAVQYALWACDACQKLPYEPRNMLLLRRRFRDARIELPERDTPSEPDPEAIRKLFEQSASGRAWYLHREQVRKTNLQKKTLEMYELELSLWNLLSTYSNSESGLNQLLLSQISSLTEIADHQWISEQNARIEAHPGEDILLPYHIEKSSKKIERNLIRCKKCGDVIESVSGPLYGFHVPRICSCGACGVDGGTHVLIRFTRTSGKEDYEELSETTGNEENADVFTALNELLRQMDEDEVFFND